MQADLRREAGLTLVEVMISLSLLALAISVATSVWMVGHAVSKDADRWGDRNEQLRMALNILGEDLTYAIPYGDPARLNWCCSVGEAYDDEALERQWIEVAIYQPRMSTAGWDAGWTSMGWPGWITQARSLRLKYALYYDGSLVRSVLSRGTPVDETYVERTVMTQLDPSSYFHVEPGRRLVEVTLRTQEMGGNPGAEARGGWQLRNVTPN